jgi:hypothetical protein
MAGQPPATTPGGTAWVMPFGRHQGQPLDEIPDGYLAWLLQRKLSSGFRRTVADELRRRGYEPPPPPPSAPPPECLRCGSVGICHTWLRARNGARMIRRSCAGCGGSFGFAPPVPEFIQQANAARRQDSPLAVLALADQRNIRLVSDGLAASIRPDDRHKADPNFWERVRAARHSLGKLLGVRRAKP